MLIYIAKDHIMWFIRFIFFTDVDLSKEGEATLTVVRERLFNAHYQAIKRNHDNPEQYLCKVISLICQVKSVARYWWSVEKSMLELYSEVHFSPIMKSLFNNQLLELPRTPEYRSTNVFKI